MGLTCQVNIMTEDVRDAVVRLQMRAADASSIHVAERCDRAIDALLRHPNKKGNAAALLQNAWGDAGKIIRRRRAILRDTLSPPTTRWHGGLKGASMEPDSPLLEGPWTGSTRTPTSAKTIGSC